MENPLKNACIFLNPGWQITESEAQRWDLIWTLLKGSGGDWFPTRLDHHIDAVRACAWKVRALNQRAEQN